MKYSLLHTEYNMSENYVSSDSVNQLLALIRSSLWQTTIEREPFSVLPIDWDEIGKMAMQQTVGPLVFDAALKLPTDLRPSKEWILKAYSIIERNKHTHTLLDKTVAEAYEKLSGVGIRTVLLKGQAYARAYPDPTLRQCGDIDMYVGEQEYRKAYEATKLFGWKSDEKFKTKAKHYGCSLNGVRIELHRIAGQLLQHSANHRFQEWSRKQLLSGTIVNIDGEKIEVPTPLFDVIFVFMHMFLHFINGGIGLRQVCDWTMLLHKHHNEIDADELEKLLKQFHLLRGWKLFTPIAVRDLGLPENECPLYSKKYVKNASNILSFILKEGNFGRASQSKSERPKGYFAGKIYSFVHHSRKQMSKMSIDPYIILRYHFSYVLKGVFQVLTDMHKGTF